MIYLVRGKYKVYPIQNTSPFVLIEIKCQSRSHAEEVLEARKKCYYDLEILEYPSDLVVINQNKS